MLKWVPDRITSSTILVVLTVIVVLHFIFLSVYTQSASTLRRQASRNAMIQKVINMVQLVYATPDANRLKAVAAIEDPHLTVSLTTEPIWPVAFKRVSYWNINRALRKDLHFFKFSILLTKHRWLNIHATYESGTAMMQILLMISELIAAAAILLAAWSIHRFTKPLKKFKYAAERLGIDRQAEPLLEYGPGIVRETAQAMNLMQKRISDLIHDRTQMLAAISHDLRTPITRLKLRAQTVSDPAEQQKIMRDLEDMETMIKQTLAFAKDDAWEEPLVKLDLCSLLQVICDDKADMGYPVTFKSSDHSLPISGRPVALKRAFTNLVDNGVKYGEQVNIHLRQHDSKAIITVDDQGAGIPETDLDKVFTPFYRMESSRSRDTGGVGLGLAVVKDIIRSHGGQITLANRKPSGLRVTVILDI